MDNINREDWDKMMKEVDKEIRENYTFIRQDLSLRIAEEYLNAFGRLDVLECDDEIKRLFEALRDCVAKRLHRPIVGEIVDEYVMTGW